MEILNPDRHSGWWCAALLLLAVAGITGVAGAGDGLPHWLTVITADQLRGDVGFLASQELAGRAVCTPGSRTAASFIASRFQALGLTPAGEGDRDFFQKVPVARTRVRSGLCRVVRGDGSVLELFWGKDFRCRPLAARGMDISAKAVFAGYGIHAPDLGHDDYAGLKVKDRVLIVLSGGPAEKGDSGHGSGLRASRYTSVSAKRAVAGSRGAAALIILPLPGTGKEEAFLRSDFQADHLVLAEEEEPVDSSCPAVLLQEDAAGRLAALAGLEMVPGGGSPRPLSGVRASCRLKMEETEQVYTRNVLCLIPGSDELFFREFVLVTAHYDHLGDRGDGLFFPGADDNASGVAAMIGAARALAALPLHRRPARSILFAAWAGEERGLLGSEHFGCEPTVPRGQIKLVINLDMVGRNNGGNAAEQNTALAIYSAQVAGLEALLDSTARAVSLDLRLRPRLQMGLISDHKVFHRLGIPAVHFFTGWHDDYNRTGDTAEKINYDKLLRVSRAAAGLAFQVADEPAPPLFDETVTEVQGRSDPF